MLVVAGVGVVTVVLAGGLLVAAVVHATHRASGLADRAALAAAAPLVRAGAADCGDAAELVRGDQGRLVVCRQDGPGSVVVEVATSLPSGVRALGVPGVVIARSRAGPVSAT